MRIFGRRAPTDIPTEDVPDAKRGLLRRVVRTLLPLVLIAAGVYVALNFPALMNQAKFWLDKPKPGVAAAQFPTVARNQATQTTDEQKFCGHIIPYGNDGQPKAICDNHVYIPALRIGAPILTPKSTDDATVNADLLRGVVRYPGTAEAGQKGNVFLTGHSSYYWWVSTEFRNVFTLLPQVNPGDEIVIYNRGIRYTYRVTLEWEVGPNQTDVLDPTPDPVVTLSTCVPIGTSYRRHIVRAKQVSPDPSTARPVSNSGVNARNLPGNR